MRRSGTQRVIAAAAGVLGAAPLAFGVLRAATSDFDLRVFWMAFVATALAAGALLTTIGRRRSRRAVIKDAIVILVFAALLAAGTSYLLGATAGPGIWAVAVAFGLSLAASSVLVAYARPRTG